MVKKIDKKLTEFTSEVDSISKKHFGNFITQKSDPYCQYIDEFEKLVKHFINNSQDAGDKPTEITSIEIVLKFRESLLSLNQKFFSREKAKSFFEEFAEYFDDLNNVLDQLPNQITLEQDDARFKITRSDSLWITFLKIFKILFYHLNKSPIYLLNSIRSLFKKKQLIIKRWKYKLPLNNLCERYFRYSYTSKLKEIVLEFYKTRSDISLELWEIEKKVGENTVPEVNVIQTSIDNARNNFKNLSEKLGLFIEENVRVIEENIKEVYPVAGTIEMSSSTFSKNKTQQAVEKFDRVYIKEINRWNNNLFALTEDWNLDLELQICSTKVHLSKNQVFALLKRKVNDEIKSGIKIIDEAIQEIIEVVDQPGYDLSSFKKTLVKQQYVCQKRITNELAPAFADNLLNQNLPQLLDKLQNSIEEFLNDFTKEHWLVSKPDYSIPIADNDLNQVNAHELIEFELFPKFEGSLNTLRNDLFRNVEKIRVTIDNIDDILSYGLESAIALIEEESKSVDETTVVAQEGFERVKNKFLELEDIIAYLNESFLDKINQPVAVFTQAIIDLTNNENLLEIRLRITRAKALAETVKFRNRVQSKLLEIIKTTRVGFISKYQISKGFILKIYARFLSKPESEMISTEVTGFLEDTQIVAQNLPFAYQRLFKVEPLKDKSLFIGRSKELKILFDSYQNWEKGRFAATSIISEKGGGITTLINFFLENLKSPYKAKRIKPQSRLYSSEGLKSYLSESFEQLFQSYDDIIDYLNKGPKKIIILEDIQILYLRKVNGFECLLKLLEIISSTNKNVFWICSANIYTWQYFQKTIQIGDFFEYVVELQEMDDEEIIEMILRRNRISGFDLYFKPSEEDGEDQKFNKLDINEQQEFLKRRFFSRLHKYAKSNLSFALIFWLNALIDVSEDTITIGNFKEPDFRFLTNLSSPKIFALQSLILHEGLTIEEYSEVMNQNAEASKLTILMLFEDGILAKSDQVYRVNFILYRKLVSLLKLKNLL